MTQSNDVLVIGAGVSGLTTAVCLAERGLDVRVVAADAPADTTSAVAGALINGQVSGDPQDPATGWSQVSVDEFGRLADEPAAGVRVLHGRMVSRAGSGPPPWASALPGFRPCDEREAAGFPMAFWIESPVVDMPRYLAYLTDRATAAGATMEIGSIDSIAEAASQAPMVINCAGLGAAELAADARMMPVRGQHVVVENPGLDEFFYERSPNPTVTSYIPHADRLVLGGTIERGERSREPNPEQAEEIIARCGAVEPRIVDAKVIRIDVGLRPGRPTVRLEAEVVDGARVIHNYGHAGIGVALSWGCAREVERLATGG